MPCPVQELLIPPGQSMADLAAKDAAQVEQLMAAAAAARAEAVAAITGQPVADTPGSRRSVGKPQGLSVADGGEIEPLEDARQSTSLEGGVCRLWWDACANAARLLFRPPSKAGVRPRSCSVYQGVSGTL